MRKPMVTRTETYYEISFTVVNMETKTITDETITIPAIDCKGKEPTIEDVRKNYITSASLIAVAINSVEKYDVLLGMYEEDFIARAMILDNETRKPIE